LNELAKEADELSYTMVTCKMKLLQNYFSLRLRPSEQILPEIISKLSQRLVAAAEYFPTRNNFSG